MQMNNNLDNFDMPYNPPGRIHGYDEKFQVKDGFFPNTNRGFANKAALYYQKLAEDNNYKPAEVITYSKGLCEAMLFPEYADGYKFPNTYNHPTCSLPLREQFQIFTNAKGCAFIQVNMGQFLDSTNFSTGIPGGGIAGANPLGYFNTGATNQNGGSTRAFSNVFFCNDISLDGRAPVANTGTVMQGVNVLQILPNRYSTVRPAPQVVKFEFSGQFVTAGGTIRVGVDTTSVAPDAAAARLLNGLEADTTYTTINVSSFFNIIFNDLINLRRWKNAGILNLALSRLPCESASCLTTNVRCSRLRRWKGTETLFTNERLCFSAAALLRLTLET